MPETPKYPYGETEEEYQERLKRMRTKPPTARPRVIEIGGKPPPPDRDQLQEGFQSAPPEFERPGFVPPEEPGFLGKFTNIAPGSPDAPELHESGRVWNAADGKDDEVSEEYKKEKWQRIGGKPPASAMVDFDNFNMPAFQKNLQDKLEFDPYDDLDYKAERATPHDASAAEKKSIRGKVETDWKRKRDMYEKAVSMARENQKTASTAKEKQRKRVDGFSGFRKTRSQYHKDLTGIYGSIAQLNTDISDAKLTPEDAQGRMAQYVKYENILQDEIKHLDSVIGDTEPAEPGDTQKTAQAPESIKDAIAEIRKRYQSGAYGPPKSSEATAKANKLIHQIRVGVQGSW